MVVPNLLTFVKSALDRNIISIFLPGDLKIYYLFPNFVVQVPDITQSRGGAKMQAVTAIDYFTKTIVYTQERSAETAGEYKIRTIGRQRS